MKAGKHPPSGNGALRLRAQERLEERLREPDKVGSDAEVRRLVHELQVHQIELELQNEELKQSAQAARQAMEKYNELYDFAPVGYFSLDRDGRITEVNLTGSIMLGVERSSLINLPFERFVEQTARARFSMFLTRSFKSRRKSACEIRLAKSNQDFFWADLESLVPASGGPRSICGVAVVDISSRKQADEVQKKLDFFAASNRKLEREILHRRKAESALRRSKHQSARLLEESRHLQERLRNLARKILRAQEEERRHISHELHDVISQTLVGVDVELSLLNRESAAIPAVLKRKIARTQRLVRRSVDVVHDFARMLRPPQLDDLGLIPALRSFVREFTAKTGVPVRLQVFPGVEGLGGHRRTVLYRVAQEAVINVGKHAHASAVNITISRIPDAVSMVISDNGRAFDVAAKLNVRTNKRLGLVGMRERVEMVGGTFSIESVAGRGTTIRLRIPFHGPRELPKTVRRAATGKKRLRRTGRKSRGDRA